MTTKTRAPAAKSAAVYAPLPKQPPPAPTKAAPKREPVQYRYQLAQFVAERRTDGWYVAKTWSTFAGEKTCWQGPFDLPEAACIAIARLLCTELSNRHQSQAGFHKVMVGDPLYGLPTLPKLSPRKGGGRS